MDDQEAFEPVRELSARQRRVLGVLVEKAFTTPDYYPMTIKALTAGCNQKSNRSPIANYNEDDVLDTLEELREIGLVGEVHTEGGRTSRWRHYVRKRFEFSEPQIAIVAELLLRQRQQPGELRTRAGRMVAIDSQETLRTELTGLLEMGYVRASGPLERRGIEVDHDFYRAKDKAPPLESPPPAEASEATAAPTSASQANPPAADTAPLRRDVDALRAEVDQLRSRLAETEAVVDQLRSELGL